MLIIKMESYYIDQIEEAVSSAHEAGKKGHDFYCIGENNEGQRVFITSEENIPDEVVEEIEEMFEESEDDLAGEHQIAGHSVIISY